MAARAHGQGQVLDRVILGRHGGQQPALAALDAPQAQGVEEAGPGYRRIAAAGRPGDDHEARVSQPRQQVVDQLLTAEEETGVAFLVGF